MVFFILSLSLSLPPLFKFDLNRLGSGEVPVMLKRVFTMSSQEHHQKVIENLLQQQQQEHLDNRGNYIIKEEQQQMQKVSKYY